MSLSSASVVARIKATETSPLDLAQNNVVHLAEFVQTFTSGTGAAQAQVVFGDTRSLAASTSEDLDLAGGVQDALGRTFTFTAVKAIIVKATATNGAAIEVGGAAATQFVGPLKDATDIVSIPAGGVFLICDPGATGWAVGAGTADLLKVNNTNGAAAGSYQIIILGEGSTA